MNLNKFNVEIYYILLNIIPGKKQNYLSRGLYAGKFVKLNKAHFCVNFAGGRLAFGAAISKFIFSPYLIAELLYH